MARAKWGAAIAVGAVLIAGCDNSAQPNPVPSVTARSSSIISAVPSTPLSSAVSVSTSGQVSMSGPASMSGPIGRGGTLAVFVDHGEPYPAAAIPVRLTVSNGCVVATRESKKANPRQFIPVFPDSARSTPAGVDIRGKHFDFGQPVILGGSGVFGPEDDPGTGSDVYIPAGCPELIRHTIGDISSVGG